MTESDEAGSAASGSPASQKPPPRPGALPRPRLFLDLAPLRLDPQYRLLLTGQVISVMGNQITRIALPYQVYVLTGSPLSIAVLTAVQLVPILVLSLVAGTIADAFDRRKVLMITQTGLAATNVGLLLLALQASPPIWAIYLLAGLAGSLLAVDWPARSSAVPRLVARERIPAAIALSQLNYNTAAIIGPAIGGVILAVVGVPGAFAADLLAFTIAFPALVRLSPIPPLHLAVAPGLTAIREGLRFAWSRKVIIAVFAIDFNAMIFGRPVALFPVLALDVFRVGPAGVGMLAAAPAVGAFLGALLSGWISSVQRIGRAVVVSVMAWGIMVTLFGLATFSFELALGLLAIAGAADVLSTVLRSTIVQTETPDHLRGRVTSIHNMSVSSGPRLGDIRATTLASLIGSQASVISGGVLCLVGAVLTIRAFPELPAHRMRLRRADPSPPPDAATPAATSAASAPSTGSAPAP